MIDAEDPQPYRIIASVSVSKDGARRPIIVQRFRTEAEADSILTRMMKDGDERALSVERLARGRRTLGTFKTKKEAEQAERAELDARDRGVDVAPSTLIVAELVERYVRSRRSLGRCGIKTGEEYDRLIRLYIEPHFRSVVIKKLRPAAVSAWVATLMESGGRAGKPISAKTAKHAFALLSSAFRWGVKMQFVAQNVCDAAEAPTSPRSEARALAGGEVTKLMHAAKGSRWESFVDLALMLGARRGELLALTWDDVDLDQGSVTIRASLSQTKAATAIKSTKTNRVRIVPLTAAALEAFRRQRLQQNEDRMRNADIFQPDPRHAIFTDEIGCQLSPKAATNAFARIAKKAGISTTSLHSTRHTAATQLIAAGVDVTTTASILGHVNANVTLALYSHVVEGAQRSAMDVLGGRLEKMRETVEVIVEEAHGNRMATAASLQQKNPRRNEGFMVAGTGFEPVTFGL